jgi:uncharacterized alpha-E superfamily protein
MLQKILESFDHIVEKMAAVSGLSVAATAHSTNQNAEWPFVTLSDFQERAGNARTLADALYVSFNPLVRKEQLAEWDEYVNGENNQWM